MKNNKSLSLFLTLILALSLDLAFTIFAYAGPSADYGDAPDPGFPSLYDTTSSRIPGRRGPFHLDTSEEWIGWSSTSTTTAENDALLTNLDSDDGTPPVPQAMIGFMGLFFPFDYARAVVPVCLSSNATNRKILYLNVLVDMNSDGQWRGNEWIARNVAVDIEPGECILRYTPLFILDRSNTTQRYVRFTLTRERINEDFFSGVDGWDGSGPLQGFSGGETEDWFISYQQLEFKMLVLSWDNPLPRPQPGEPLVFPSRRRSFFIPTPPGVAQPILLFINNWGTMDLELRRIKWFYEAGNKNMIIAPGPGNLPQNITGDLNPSSFIFDYRGGGIIIPSRPPIPPPFPWRGFNFSAQWNPPTTPPNLPWWAQYKVVATADPYDINIQEDLEAYFYTPETCSLDRDQIYSSPTPSGSDVNVNFCNEALIAYQTIGSLCETHLTLVTTPGHNPPHGFRFVTEGYFDISTSCDYTDSIMVTLSYDDAYISGEEGNLKLFHWNGNVWEDCTISIDTVNNTITGRVNTLSPFGLGYPYYPTGINTNLIVILGIFAISSGVLLIRKRRLDKA